MNEISPELKEKIPHCIFGDSDKVRAWIAGYNCWHPGERYACEFEVSGEADDPRLANSFYLGIAAKKEEYDGERLRVGGRETYHYNEYSEHRTHDSLHNIRQLYGSRGSIKKLDHNGGRRPPSACAHPKAWKSIQYQGA